MKSDRFTQAKSVLDKAFAPRNIPSETPLTDKMAEVVRLLREVRQSYPHQINGDRLLDETIGSCDRLHTEVESYECAPRRITLPPPSDVTHVGPAGPLKKRPRRL